MPEKIQVIVVFNGYDDSDNMKKSKQLHIHIYPHITSQFQISASTYVIAKWFLGKCSKQEAVDHYVIYYTSKQ